MVEQEILGRMRVAVFFIIEGKTLEKQALLLAHSLYQHNRGDIDCIAYVPSTYVDELDPFTIAFLAERGVKIVPLIVPNRFWRRPFPQGNKIVAAAQKRDCDYSLFLDTDICCTGPIFPQIDPDDTRLFAVPEGVPTWGSEGGDWEQAYKFFRLPVPEERIRLVRQKRRLFYPYFNAGYVAFPERDLVTGMRFGDLWLQTAVAFDFGARVPKKRPWLDQITLPLTLYRFGLPYEVLGDEYNFSTKARQSKGESIHAAHYHRDAGFLQWKEARRTFDRFTRDICATEDGARIFDNEEAFLSAITGKRRT